MLSDLGKLHSLPPCTLQGKASNSDSDSKSDFDWQVRGLWEANQSGWEQRGGWKNVSLNRCVFYTMDFDVIINSTKLRLAKQASQEDMAFHFELYTPEEEQGPMKWKQKVILKTEIDWIDVNKNMKPIPRGEEFSRRLANLSVSSPEMIKNLDIQVHGLKLENSNISIVNNSVWVGGLLREHIVVGDDDKMHIKVRVMDKKKGYRTKEKIFTLIVDEIRGTQFVVSMMLVLFFVSMVLLVAILCLCLKMPSDNEQEVAKALGGDPGDGTKKELSQEACYSSNRVLDPKEIDVEKNAADETIIDDLYLMKKGEYQKENKYVPYKERYAQKRQEEDGSSGSGEEEEGEFEYEEFDEDDLEENGKTKESEESKKASQEDKKKEGLEIEIPPIENKFQESSSPEINSASPEKLRKPSNSNYSAGTLDLQNSNMKLELESPGIGQTSLADIGGFSPIVKFDKRPNRFVNTELAPAPVEMENEEDETKDENSTVPIPEEKEDKDEKEDKNEK